MADMESGAEVANEVTLIKREPAEAAAAGLLLWHETFVKNTSIAHDTARYNEIHSHLLAIRQLIGA